jgi:hypothetical protein
VILFTFLGAKTSMAVLPFESPRRANVDPESLADRTR